MMQVREVADTQALALQHTEPLLAPLSSTSNALVKPNRQSGGRLKPGLNLLAFMHAQVSKHQPNATNGGGNLLIQMGKPRDELFLPLAHCRSSIDLPSAGIKSGKQMQSAYSFVAMLQASWVARSVGKGGRQTRTRLQIGFLVGTQHHLFIGEWTRVEIHQAADLLREVLIPGNVCRKPQMMPPWFEFVRAQNAGDGVGRNALHQAIGFQFASQFWTIPWREGASHLVGSFTRQFDNMEGYF